MVHRELRLDADLARRIRIASAAVGMSANAFTCAAADAAIRTIAEQDDGLAKVLAGPQIKLASKVTA